jgi:3D (Asp-Asp-Asp) domain-containing protein
MKKNFLSILSIIAILCTNITAFAQVDITSAKETIIYYEERTIYNEEGTISTNLATDVKSVTIAQTGTQIIPTEAFDKNLVNLAEVVYRFTYKVTAKRVDGQTATNMPIYTIVFTGPICGSKFTHIDSTGVGYIDIDVRGTKNFTMYCTMQYGAVRSNQVNTTPAVQAKYQSEFYCTGYITALESDYSGALVSAPGITGATFINKFLDAVKLNGSGKANSGQFLHYNGNTGQYSYLDPTTATGTTPVAGRTIAVDPYYIPRAKVNNVWKRATVSIANIGTRVAEDGGGAIIGYRIDVYNGIGTSSMAGWTNGNRAVSLISVN